MSALAVKAQPISTAVQIRVVGAVQPDGVTINYVTSSLNKAKTFANTLYVWKVTSPDVPWGIDPDGTTAIAKDTPVSSQKIDFKFLLKQAYIIGYAVAADPNATCATIYIPADSQNEPLNYVNDSMDLKVPNWDSNIVQVSYATLPKYNPAENKNWVGIWENEHVPYSGEPLAKTSITRNQTKGQVNINVELTIDTSYAVGYFMADAKSGRTALAASTTFHT